VLAWLPPDVYDRLNGWLSHLAERAQWIPAIRAIGAEPAMSHGGDIISGEYFTR
jgi:hypothetical protein